MAESIRVKEWLDELLRIPKKVVQVDGFATRDLVIELGVSESAAQNRMRALHRRGLIKRAGSRIIQTIDGHSTPVPVYVLVKQPAKKR